MNTKATETQPMEADGLVIHTDGSARPNPGFIGWGFHGYTYNEAAPKKGAGHPTHIPTAHGYILKSAKNEKNPEVTPLVYLDAYGCRTLPGTNNTAELLALSDALVKAKDFKIKTLTIKTDSEYVRKGLTEWSPGWIRRNWIRDDGSAVPNQYHWKDVLSKITDLKTEGVQFNIDWVKAHSTVVGNNMADTLALVGTLRSTSGNERNECKSTLAQGYWKTDIDRHPFIANRRMYFSTLKASHVPGEYYLGEHGKDDEMLGKRISDGTYSCVQLAEPNPVMEFIRTVQSEHAVEYDTLVMVRLDALFKPSTYGQIQDYDHAAVLRPIKSRLDLFTLEEEPLTKELKPQRIAMRAIESISFLKQILEKYKTKELGGIVLTDITDVLYEKTIKTKKKEEIVEMNLRNNFTVGVSALPVKVKAPTKNGPLELDTILTFGVDILDRNALKRLESKNPIVNVAVWQEAPDVYRYATIIESEGSYGVWAGFYSNMIYHH